MADSDSSIELIIARWSDRFIAWLIDFLIISSISLIIITSWFGTFDLEWNENMMYSRVVEYIPGSVLFFSYWIILEYKTGQSIGKRILNLKIVNMNGGNPTIVGVILSSFGKSFLLPIDMILGLILTNEKRQRIFNKIGDTVVIKIKNTEEVTEKIKYKKD